MVASLQEARILTKHLSVCVLRGHDPSELGGGHTLGKHTLRDVPRWARLSGRIELRFS